MPQPDIQDLVVTALNALASAPDGMTVPDFTAHIESRQGPTEEEASDARSSESRQMQATISGLITGTGSLVDRGYATNDGGILHITPAGRAAVGR